MLVPRQTKEVTERDADGGERLISKDVACSVRYVALMLHTRNSVKYIGHHTTYYYTYFNDLPDIFVRDVTDKLTARGTSYLNNEIKQSSNRAIECTSRIFF